MPWHGCPPAPARPTTGDGSPTNSRTISVNDYSDPFCNILLWAWPRRCRRSGFQVAQDGEHPAVVGIRRGQGELAEDVRDVLFDGPLGYHESRGDRVVGPALGHQRQHLALSGCEGAELVGTSAGRQKLRDDFRVGGGPPGGHPAQSFEELIDVADPVLEQ